jgi:transaldolase/glucose-6-phosphate isomerase
MDSLLNDAIAEELKNWQKFDKTRRLWANDASLWTNSDEARWMGWLGLVSSELEEVPRIEALASEIKTAGFKLIVVLGMGGSSI